MLVFRFQDRESAFSLGININYYGSMCSERACTFSLVGVDLENFSGGKPPDPIFLLLWYAVATGLPCLVQYEGLHAYISKRPGVVTCIAWAYKRSRRQSISGMKFQMELGHLASIE